MRWRVNLDELEAMTVEGGTTIEIGLRQLAKQLEWRMLEDAKRKHGQRATYCANPRDVPEKH